MIKKYNVHQWCKTKEWGVIQRNELRRTLEKYYDILKGDRFERGSGEIIYIFVDREELEKMDKEINGIGD